MLKLVIDEHHCTKVQQPSNFFCLIHWVLPKGPPFCGCLAHGKSEGLSGKTSCVFISSQSGGKRVGRGGERLIGSFRKSSWYFWWLVLVSLDGGFIVIKDYIALLWQQPALQMRQEQMHGAANENPNVLWKKPENCSRSQGCSKNPILFSHLVLDTSARLFFWCGVPKLLVRNFESLGLIWGRRCSSWWHTDSMAKDSFGQSGLKN